MVRPMNKDHCRGCEGRSCRMQPVPRFHKSDASLQYLDELIVWICFLEKLPCLGISPKLLLEGCIPHQQFDAHRQNQSMLSVCEGDCLLQKQDLDSTQGSASSSTCATPLCEQEAFPVTC